MHHIWAPSFQFEDFIFISDDRLEHFLWRDAIEQQVKMGVRAEQQAFAKFHLNFVMETYLPDKLGNPKGMLP